MWFFSFATHYGRILNQFLLMFEVNLHVLFRALCALMNDFGCEAMQCSVFPLYGAGSQRKLSLLAALYWSMELKGCTTHKSFSLLLSLLFSDACCHSYPLTFTCLSVNWGDPTEASEVKRKYTLFAHWLHFTSMVGFSHPQNLAKEALDF